MFVAVLVLAGCTVSTSSKRAVPPVDVSTTADPGPQRLAVAVDALPPPNAVDWMRAGDAFRSLHVVHGGVPRAGFAVDADETDAARYNTILVRLTARGTDACLLTWTSDHEPELGRNPGLRFPVVPDGEPHPYAISPRGVEASTWQGIIRQLAVLSESPDGSIAVEDVTLTNGANPGPYRVTLDHETMEAVTAPTIIWRLTVPPEGVLELCAGMIPRAWELPACDGVTFRVRAVAADGVESVLLERPYVPAELGDTARWLPLRAELSSYAGQAIRLVLETDGRDNPVGDYAVWGNPVVYSSEPDASQTPVILISIDTLRAGHVRLYGYDRDTAPNLAAFAEEAVVFNNAFTPETWTLTAHVSMLTGLYPNHHHVNATTNLAEPVQTLPEVLAENGYLCAGFTGYRIWMLPWRGLAHGFDRYSTPDVVRDIHATAALVNPWLDAHGKRPFFLFFHNYDLHSKYDELGCVGCDLPYFPPREADLHFSKAMDEPPSLRADGRPRATNLLFAAQDKRETISPEELAYMQALYDDAIRGVDAALGAFFDTLRAKGIYDRALIIVTSDHGEHFGEHGQYLHEHLYEGSAHVPLLIRFPAGERGGQRVDEMTSLVDLAPTVLDYLDLSGPAADGRSLLPLVSGRDVSMPNVFIRRQRYQAIRTPQWKLIRNIETGERELYDMASDPHETRDLYAPEHPAAPDLAAELDRFFEENPQGWHIAFTTPDPHWRGTVVLSSEYPVDAAKLFFGGSLSRQDLMKREERSFTVTLGPLPREEILFRSEFTDAEVRLSIRSESPFRLVLPGGIVHNGAAYDGVFTPSAGAPAKRADMPDEVTIPTLVVWHEEETAKGTSAPELTPEDRQTLDGLGYGR